MSRILLFDIENTPIITYAWGIHDEPSHSTKFVKKDWMIMCWAAKWLGEKEIITADMWGKKDDSQLLKKLWKLLDKADVVIAHNGKKFDIRKANARFVQNKMSPPSPYKIIDTLTEARKYFMFTSNRLGDLGKYLEVGSKMETGGFDLWIECMDNNKKSQAKMLKYCAGDVLLLEKVYLKIRPYMKTHPNLSIYIKDRPACVRCGGLRVKKRGIEASPLGTRQEWFCNDCGKGFSTRNGKIIEKKKLPRCPKCGEPRLRKSGSKYFSMTGVSQYYLCGACGGWSGKKIRTYTKEEREQITKNA